MPLKIEDFGDDVDQATFEQILEMDEDNDKEFSRSIVFGFFEQAEETFKNMEQALEDRDLPELSKLGHFLKGSSATLGFTKVRDECEKIQNLGSGKNDTGEFDEPDEGKCLRLIGQSIKAVKEAYRVVEDLMSQFYED